MRIYFGYRPQCDALKAVEVELTTQRQGGDVYWSDTFVMVSSDRAPEHDECACELTPEGERTVIASVEDDAINAEPDYAEPD